MARNSTSFKAVILAGGSGTRFWPLSTPSRPKQFLDVFGGESLLRATARRLLPLAGADGVFVVTARELVGATRRELKGLVPSGNVIGEPCRRDTAAAVALGVAKAGEGTIGVFPADHVVLREAALRNAVKAAAKRAANSAKIVTLGIAPKSPSTQFGYVDPKSGKFAEKPDGQTAREYIRKGFLWNAGIFVASSETFRDAICSCAGGLEPLFVRGGRLDAKYAALPKISFDFAVMEKYPHIDVVPCDCGWNDAGGYDALAALKPGLVDDSGNLVVAPEGMEVKLLGVKNLVVAATRNGILVADRSRLGEMKKLFAK